MNKKTDQPNEVPQKEFDEAVKALLNTPPNPKEGRENGKGKKTGKNRKGD